ncbi:polo kinase [Toxoplasma gondii CAST]|uniref:Polo kinase n=1 Tax=Toxoplasma gondii CAST TaxID=943122 RepID=A0A3R7Z028_TOXGO|nr:polo kinase [Toxoplasma gondii CAST]
MRRSRSKYHVGTFVTGLAVQRLTLLGMYSAVWVTSAHSSPVNSATVSPSFFFLHSKPPHGFPPNERTTGESSGSNASIELMEMQPTQPESLSPTAMAARRPNVPPLPEASGLPSRLPPWQETPFSPGKGDTQDSAQVSTPSGTPRVQPISSPKREALFRMSPPPVPKRSLRRTLSQYFRARKHSGVPNPRASAQLPTVDREQAVNRPHRASRLMKSSPSSASHQAHGAAPHRRRAATSPQPRTGRDPAGPVDRTLRNWISDRLSRAYRHVRSRLRAGYARLLRQLHSMTEKIPTPPVQLPGQECVNVFGAHVARQVADWRQQMGRTSLEFAVDAAFPRDKDILFKSYISRKSVTLRMGKVLGGGARSIVVEVTRVDTGDRWALKAFLVPRDVIGSPGTPPPWDAISEEAHAIKLLPHTVPAVVYRNLRFLVPADVLIYEGDGMEKLWNRRGTGSNFYTTYLLFPIAQGSLLDAVRAMFRDARRGNAEVSDGEAARTLAANVSFSIQIIRLTALLHSHGVVHGDFQTKSFFLCQDGSLFLGRVRSLTRVGAPYRSPSSATDSPRCTPPEVLSPPENAAFTFSLNAWELGCILYQLWCGGLPFGLSPTPETPGKIVLPPVITSPYLQTKKRSGLAGTSTRPVKHLVFTGCVKNMPVEMRQLIRRLLQEDPHKRLLPTEILRDPVFQKLEEQSRSPDAQA